MTISVGFCTIFGVMLAERYHTHARIVEDMLHFCRMIRVESACGGENLLQLMQKFQPQTQQVQCFLENYRQNLQDNPSHRAWTLALQQFSNKYGITQREHAVFLQMEKAMGSFLSSQQQNLQNLEGELEALLQDANRQSETRGMLCAKLGLLFGIAAAVLLM